MGLLDRKTRQQLVDILAGMMTLNTSAGRTLLLQDLPWGLTNMIARSESKLLDLNAMVDSCEHWDPAEGTPHPTRLLIENARNLVTGSGTATRLQTILDSITPSAAVPTPTPNTVAVPTPALAEDERPAALRAAFAPFLADLDEIGNPELITKARELRSALQQTEPDVEHITELRRWFAGRPDRARDTAAAFFTTPIVRRIIAEATQREYGS